MDCILGINYGLEVHYDGEAEPDMQNVIVDD